MKKLFALLLTLLLTACSTMQVETDYDQNFDFKTLRTFAVVVPVGTSGETLTQQRIAKALTLRMINKGYIQVDKSKADVIMSFHIHVTNKQQIVTDYQMMGYAPMYGFGFGGTMAVPVQSTYDYKEGKIVIDALNRTGKNIFWQSVVTDELKTFKSPEKREQYLYSVVDSAMKSFPEKHDIQ